MPEVAGVRRSEADLPYGTVRGLASSNVPLTGHRRHQTHPHGTDRAQKEAAASTDLLKPAALQRSSTIGLIHDSPAVHWRML
jgi:hypothetical protein